MTMPPKLALLTPRQRRYVLELSFGKSRPAIAHAMGVAIITAAGYHHQASQRLQVNTRRLAAWAVCQGWRE